jgi:uncharacterized membrane protein
LLGIFFNILIFIFILAKGILDGGNVIILTLITAFLVIPQMFYLTHGWNNKTHAAVLGVLINLCITIVFMA